MKRARILALCALGVAAAVVSVQWKQDSHGPGEEVLGARDGAALAPPLREAVSTSEEHASLARVAPDTSRVDLSLEVDRLAVQDDSAPEADPVLAADHVPLRLVGADTSAPDGGASNDCVAFKIEPTAILDEHLDLVRANDGRLWLARRTLEALVAEGDPARPLHLALLDRTRSRPRIGFIGGPFDAAVTELVLEEVGTAQVALRVEQRLTTRVVLSVHAQLLAAGAADPRMGRIAVEMGLGFDWGSLELGPDVQVAALPSGLLPGRWRLAFDLASAPLVRLAPIEVELVAGRQEVMLELPDLFEVTVHAPALGVGERLRLRPSSAAATAAPGRAALDYAALDAGHRVVFSGLPAGHYVLTHGASHAPENIVVPCGEVLYEPRRSDAFEVRLAPLDGGGQGALARAGFQSGDVLLDFNGRGLREHDDLDALLQVIAENEATVRVRRGAHTLELRVGPMPDPGDPWATFDADFVPAWR